MRKMFLLAASATLVAVSPVLAQGHGNGGGKAGGQAKGGGQGKGGPPGQQGGGKGVPQGQHGGKGNPGHGNDRGPPQARADRGPQQVRGPERKADRGPQQAQSPERKVDRGPQQMRGPERQAERAGGTDRGRGNDVRGPERGNVPVAVVREDRRGSGFDGGGKRGQRVDRVRYVDNGRYYAGAPAIIDGCPPGLAKKGNGCLPPGQARRIWGNPQPYDNWYGNWSSWRDDSRYDYRYADGYLYRVDPTTSLVSAFLPLLGGALFGGNSWPQSYDNYDVPQYYDDYYGYDDDLDYRYADGAILGVNPQSNSIEGIAALLTGSDWNVGQAMPAGYDFYNVPPEYRDRYADGADNMYRYSDGYVYQVDPTTRLVEQAIQLLS